MPRVKNKAQKRTNPNENEVGGNHTRPKRQKTSHITKKRIKASLSTGEVVLSSIYLPWTPPEGLQTPTSLSFYAACGEDESKVLANDLVPLVISEKLASVLLHKQVSILCKESNDSELCLNVAVKLPLMGAQSLIECLFEREYQDFSEEDNEDDAWRQFFTELEIIQMSRQAPCENYQHEDLVPTLRGYQNKAVGWMVQRERNPGVLNTSWLSEVVDEFFTEDGQSVFYAKYSGVLYSGFGLTPTSSGGILADEMGLGKTVMTLALILNQPCLSLDDWQLVTSPTKRNDSLSVLKNSPKKKRSGLSQRELHQESCLTADEELQLVPNKLQKGMLRSKLNDWYENKLAEMSVNRGSPQREQRLFKCICGDDIDTLPKDSVQCECCGLVQHARCCGLSTEKTYVCPSCWKQQAPYPSRATLLIVPPAIFDQWASEIERHTPNLKMIQYTTTKGKFFQPAVLADFDIVITTYAVLRAECPLSLETSGRTMRAESRFLLPSCPLERVAWWRVVCDEAQMVESDFSLVRQMTSRLHATHRWCVTGTPIQNSVADLYYLTSFMGLGNFDYKEIWTNFLLKPYFSGCKTPLLSVIQQIFWRSTKQQVNSELGVPDQTFVKHSLKFTAIEETFYMQEHHRSANKFSTALTSSKVDPSSAIKSVNKGRLKKLLQPLLNIRQACTHPQVVHGIKIKTSSGAANLGELLQYLLTKTKQECEEALRRHVAALNGLAGLYYLQDDWGKAIENYRCVLRLAEEYKTDEARIDPLQRIHAMHNAAEVLEDHPNCAPPTLRDGTLRADAAEVEKNYLTKAQDLFSSSKSQAKALNMEISNAFKSFELSSDAWWVPVVLACTNFERELVDKLAEDLHTNDLVKKTVTKQFIAKLRSIHSIQVVVRSWWGAVLKLHETVSKSMSTLIDMPCNVLVEEALGCHLRVQGEARKSCELCKLDRKMQDLECELFDTTKKEVKDQVKVIDGPMTKGSWKASLSERTLAIVFNFARGKVKLEKWCVADGRRHLKLLEAMKKEFRQTRALWTGLNHRVQSEDELTMAKIRLRLAEPWETDRRPNILALSAPNQSKTDTINLVPHHEVPQMMIELEAEKGVALSDFKRKMGKLFYLKNLAKDKNATPDPCPVCQTPIENQWTVLHCGHCFCLECLQMLSCSNTPHRTKQVKCPVCRESTLMSELGFVDTTVTTDQDDVNVIGALSTKVDSIVREVIRLIKTDANVKILIFSTWAEVLKILDHAFNINHVSYLALPSSNHQKILERFKNTSNVSVLMMPLAWGSKGLNLVEATHVFLVEPILNPAEELQAIGRVHRIGQTRPTVVHRFIVNGTVEEKIFSVVSEAKDSWMKQTVTFNDLQTLFAIPPKS